MVVHSLVTVSNVWTWSHIERVGVVSRPCVLTTCRGAGHPPGTESGRQSESQTAFADSHLSPLLHGKQLFPCGCHRPVIIPAPDEDPEEIFDEIEKTTTIEDRCRFWLVA